ncbi:hypothetical protein [Bacterioplanes sanyensis]|uniref:hypothetical protein n=1 Tax=Bacterioplanes sanyensis TaxID=1249553 RepID=UPI0018EE5815|nr:hypothetical protein [Bacterioplanes sanyensis]
MQCPQCKGSQLQPVTLETGLVAAGCLQCGGSLLPLLNYRYWQQTTEQHSIEKDNEFSAEDSAGAKLCPKCARLMSKYRIGHDQDNRLELCATCDEAWLDAGEWSLLKSCEMHQQLPRIFTDAWQRLIRLTEQEASVRENFRNRLGEVQFAKADEFRQWLNQQQGKADILQYLSIRPASNSTCE